MDSANSVPTRFTVTRNLIPNPKKKERKKPRWFDQMAPSSYAVWLENLSNRAFSKLLQLRYDRHRASILSFSPGLIVYYHEMLCKIWFVIYYLFWVFWWWQIHDSFSSGGYRCFASGACGYSSRAFGIPNLKSGILKLRGFFWLFGKNAGRCRKSEFRHFSFFPLHDTGCGFRWWIARIEKEKK